MSTIGNLKATQLLDRVEVAGIRGGIPGGRAHVVRHESSQLADRFLVLSDLGVAWFSAAVAYEATAAYLRRSHFAIHVELLSAQIVGLIFLYAALVVLFEYVHGLYTSPRTRHLGGEVKLLALSVTSAAITMGFCLYWVNLGDLSLVLCGAAIATSWAALALWRKSLRSQAIEGLSERRNVLIVGCGVNGVLLRRHLEQSTELGYVFKGYIDRRQSNRPPDPARNQEESDVLGAADQLLALARKHCIDEVFISVPTDWHLIEEIAKHAHTARLQVRVIPDLCDGLTARLPADAVGEFPTLRLYGCPIPTVQLILKRFLDLVVSSVLLVASLPFLLIVAAIVKLDSRGPLFYRSLRVGKKGRTFICYKFRTMVVNAEALKESLQHLNQRDGVLFKISDDPRVTRVGRYLRKFSIDEMPQLWNVLRGEMSMVGPRPPVSCEYSQYGLEHLRRLDVTPGVTGLWQVKARRNPSFASYIQLDREYVDNWSFWLDFRILWQTIGVVLAGNGE